MLVLCLAALLRLPGLNHLSLGIDEGFTLALSRQPWPEVLGLNGFYDFHPPLFYAAAKAAALVVPEVTAGRTVAAIAGALTVVVFYLICRRLLDPTGALAATATLAVSPLHVFYSRWGRMYTPMLLAVMVSYLALLLYRDSPAWRWTVLYAVAVATALYIDYSAVYGLVPQAILLVVVGREQRARVGRLVASATAAILLFAPWIPQLLSTSSRARNYAGSGRDSLRISWSNIINTIPVVVGIDGFGSRANVANPNAWDRWPDARMIFLLMMVPALTLGVVAVLKTRRAALPTALLAIGTPLTAMAMSLVSPGFAPRTIIAAVPGLALLVGAGIGKIRDGTIPHVLRIAGAVSWCGMIALSALALPAVYQGGSFNRWPELTEALVSERDLGWPIVTFSNGGIVTDYISVYAHGRLQGTKIITIVDGPYEDATGAEWLKARGLTQADVKAGALDAALPADDPANDAVWFVERYGGNTVREQFTKMGYERVYATRYYKAEMELYVRHGAQIGQVVDLNGRFTGRSDTASGWHLPTDGYVLRPHEGGGRELVLVGGDGSNRARLRTPATAGVYLLDLALRAPADADGSVTLVCESPSGEKLASYARPVAETDVGTGRLRIAERCPDGTASVAIILEGHGAAEIAFADLRLYKE